MPYLERTPTHRSLVLLIVLFGVLYLPNLATRELRLSEALNGTVAEEMIRTGTLWSTRVHGDPVEKYPLYPWFVAACRYLGAEDEWAVRLPASVSIAVLALLSAAMAYRHGGGLAAIVAAGMIVTNVACLRVGRRAQSETVFACLLSASWLTWYIIGQRHKRWTLAWFGAFAFLLPATFTVGGRAIAYFYLPFLFLRRPVKGRRRLALPSHLVPLGLFAAIIMAWLHRVPGQAFFPWNELRTIPRVSLSYPFDLFLFPAKCAVYLFPWTFLCWPPFCMAYRRLERSPVTFHYLRTIVLSAFISAWLLPHVSPLSLLPVLPALAIMTGLHADIMLRRHIVQLRRLPAILAGTALLVSLAGLLIAFLHLSGVVDFQGMEVRLVYPGSGLLAAAAAAAAMVLRGPLRRQPFRIQLFISFAAAGLAVISLHDPWAAWAGNESKVAGAVLAGRQDPPTYLLADSADVDVVPSAGDGGDVEGGLQGREPSALPPDLPADGAPRTEAVHRPLAASVVFQTTRSYYLVPCFYLGQPVIRIADARTNMPLPAAPGAPPEALADPDPRARPGAELDPAVPSMYVDAVYAFSAGGPPILPEVLWRPLTPPLNLRGRKAIRASWFPGGVCLVRLRAVGLKDAEESQAEPVQIFRGVRR